MMVLSIRTDKPLAEIGLYKDGKPLEQFAWEAHRQLAETLHRQLEALLSRQALAWGDIQGIICFQGPGSFTGLRIGLSVGNALAYAHQIPIVACGGEDQTWLQAGLAKLQAGQNEQIVTPEYGSAAIVTAPKK